MESSGCALEISALSYGELELPNGAIVYCDPPYEGTGGYNGVKFDSPAFWDWAREKSKNHFVAVSEYEAPADFVSILSVSKTCSYSATNNSKRTLEKVFVHESRVADFKATKAQAELELMEAAL